MSKFSERLKELRLEANLTQLQLANETDFLMRQSGYGKTINEFQIWML